MESLLRLLVIVGLVVLIINFFKKRFSDGAESGALVKQKLPYRRKDYLFTVAEKNFYHVLSEVAEKRNELLFAKVRLEDLLWLPKYTTNRFGWRNRVKSRHIDFVLCDKQNIRPILAIELDDSSHQTEERIERDNNIDHILNDAGLPILHVKVRPAYEMSILENQIQKVSSYANELQ